MDTLKDKQYYVYDYKSRYINVPNYYDTLMDRNVAGIGSNMKKNISYYSHKIRDNDTLDSLALKYYNNPSYWWVIAYFNDIQDPFIPLTLIYKNSDIKVIQIPAIASVEFGAEK